MRACRYVRRLQKRYMPNPHLDPDDAPAEAAAEASPDLKKVTSNDPSLKVGWLGF